MDIKETMAALAADEAKQSNSGPSLNMTPSTEQAVVVPPEVSTDETPEDQEPAIDYKALYEKEQEKLSKAEYTLYKKRKEEKEAKAQQVQNQGYIDPAEMDKLLEEKLQLFHQVQQEKEAEDTIAEILFELSSDPDERALIRMKYENSLVKTGYSRLAIRQDLEDARFLANKPRYLKEKTELAQTAIARKTTNNTGVGTNAQKPEPQDDLSKQFTAGDWDFMQKRKFTKEQIQQAARLKQTK